MHKTSYQNFEILGTCFSADLGRLVNIEVGLAIIADNLSPINYRRYFSNIDNIIGDTSGKKYR